MPHNTAGENAVHVLVTSSPAEGKGGVAALHQILFGKPFHGRFTYVLLPVSSPMPFLEKHIDRVLRLTGCVFRFLSMLWQDRSMKLVHINTSYDLKGVSRDSLFIFIAWLLKRKIVLQIHSTVASPKNPAFVDLLARWFFPLCRKILVFSRQDRNYMERLGIQGKTEIFPNAVNVTDFSNNSSASAGFFSIPEGAKVVLFLSRLLRTKGVYELIDAVPSVLQECRNTYFIFAGDGPEKEKMESVCTGKNIRQHVRFPGHLQKEDISKAFSCADIFVLPTSHLEGMPMAILEALAAGVPIVTTPVGAIPDIVKDGINGFFVDPHSPDQIAEKILSLLRNEDLSKRMKDSNLLLARMEYDRDIVLKKLENLYLSL